MSASKSIQLKSLSSKLQGKLITPSDKTYNEAKNPWSGLIETKPLAIALCKNVHDIQTVISFATSHGIPLSVRGGGHDFAGRALCEGIVISTSAMKSVRINTEKKTAAVASGATGGDVAQKAQTQGFFTTTGNMSTVGITGLALGGGYGPIMCEYGLVTDNVVSFTLVDGKGQVVVANEKENPELYFGLRGGGGNFGVVTEMTFRLFEGKPLFAGILVFPIKNAKKLFSSYLEVMAHAPDTLTTTIGFTSMKNEPVIYINFVACGKLSEGEKLLKTFVSFDTPLLNTVRQVSYFDLISKSSEGAPYGRNYYLRTLNIKKLTKSAIADCIELAKTFSSPISILPMLHSRGKVMRNSDTAFAYRDEHFMVELIACWDGRSEKENKRHIQWVRDAQKLLSQYALPGGYVSLLEDQETKRVKEAYGKNLNRIKALKRKYDPQDIFHSSGHVAP